MKKCCYCGGNADKIRKDTYNCADCGEFTEQDVKQESGQKNVNKKKFTGNIRRA